MVMPMQGLLFFAPILSSVRQDSSTRLRPGEGRPVQGSGFVVHGSRFSVHGSRLVASGWWLVISEWLSAVHDEIRGLSTANGDELFRRRSSDIGHR